MTNKFISVHKHPTMMAKFVDVCGLELTHVTISYWSQTNTAMECYNWVRDYHEMLPTELVHTAPDLIKLRYHVMLNQHRMSWRHWDYDPDTDFFSWNAGALTHVPDGIIISNAEEVLAFELLKAVI